MCNNVFFNYGEVLCLLKGSIVLSFGVKLETYSTCMKEHFGWRLYKSLRILFVIMKRLSGLYITNEYSYYKSFLIALSFKQSIIKLKAGDLSEGKGTN